MGAPAVGSMLPQGPGEPEKIPVPAASTMPAVDTILDTPVQSPGRPGTPAGPSLEKTESNPSTKIALLIDGMLSHVTRSGDPEETKARYSGKKKTTVFNTNIVTDCRGMIIAISKTVQGSMHDLKLFREDMPKLGRITTAMLDPDTPPEERPAIYVDRGYQGIHKDLPGADIYIPIKRNMGSDPETGRLSQEDRDQNTAVSRVRITVEHTIGKIKQYEIMRKQYRGTPEEFNKELNVITGLVNFKTTWNETASKNAALIKKITAWRHQDPGGTRPP